MALTTDIAATYRGPRAAVRRQIEIGVTEARLAMYLILACGLNFVAQLPRLRREAYLDAAIPFDARVGGALLGWMFIAPLALYAVALLCRWLMHLFGGRGTGLTARLALFWALLAASPLWLLNGLVAGFIGPGAELSLTGAAALGVFVLFWGLGLVETEFAQVPA